MHAEARVHRLAKRIATPVVRVAEGLDGLLVGIAELGLEARGRILGKGDGRGAEDDLQAGRAAHGREQRGGLLAHVYAMLISGQ